VLPLVMSSRLGPEVPILLESLDCIPLPSYEAPQSCLFPVLVTHCLPPIASRWHLTIHAIISRSHSSKLLTACPLPVVVEHHQRAVLLLGDRPAVQGHGPGGHHLGLGDQEVTSHDLECAELDGGRVVTER